MAVKEILKRLDIHFVVVDLGEIDIMEELNHDELKQLRKELNATGLELMEDKKAVLIEKIKSVIIEMIHRNEELPKVNYSEYISKTLKYDYTYLSNIFSEVKGITIQQFIIINKVEFIKELLLYNELSLTEISYRFDYSSVGHLSNQFKKVTGLTPSLFKQLKNKGRIPIERVGN